MLRKSACCERVLWQRWIRREGNNATQRNAQVHGNISVLDLPDLVVVVAPHNHVLPSQRPVFREAAVKIPSRDPQRVAVLLGVDSPPAFISLIVKLQQTKRTQGNQAQVNRCW